MTRHTDKQRGFTLVEAVIVAVVIAVILAVTIPWMRERERARLQAIADTAPWEVFEFHATPTKELFTADEGIVIRCEYKNLTDYPLTLPRISGSLLALISKPRSMAALEESGLALDSVIAPRESMIVERVFTINGRSYGALECRVISYFDTLFDRRFHSNPISLVVEKGEGYYLRTFEEKSGIHKK